MLQCILNYNTLCCKMPTLFFTEPVMLKKHLNCQQKLDKSVHFLLKPIEMSFKGFTFNYLSFIYMVIGSNPIHDIMLNAVETYPSLALLRK